MNNINLLCLNSHPLKLTEINQEKVFNYFQSAWQLYEWLFSGLDQAQLQQLQPHPYRNTLNFYYGHTAAFYANKLHLAGFLDKPLSNWDAAMAKGVWPKSAQDIAASQNWPSFSELKPYRLKVYNTIVDIIEKHDFNTGITEKDKLWALLMAIEHEFVHFQTSVPLIRRVPLPLVTPPQGWQCFNFKANNTVEDTWLSFNGGEVSFGREPEENIYYGWDSDYGQKTTTVAPFTIKKYAVTNKEYLAFVEAGGYQNKALWTTPEVDIWFKELSLEYPAAWIKTDNTYRYRAPFEEIDMPWDWPVEVNKHEAQAYANWAQARLLTEPEFHYLLQLEYENTEQLTQKLFDLNTHLHFNSPIPVSDTIVETSKTKVDLFGNVSRWIDGIYQPLNPEQFKPHPFYPDYSEPWFRGDHSLVLGASYISLGHTGHIGVIRDFMQNHMDQIAGISLVKN